MVDLDKSIVHKQLLLVESKGQGETDQTKTPDLKRTGKEKKQSNMNMIERDRA